MSRNGNINTQLPLSLGGGVCCCDREAGSYGPSARFRSLFSIRSPHYAKHGALP